MSDLCPDCGQPMTLVKEMLGGWSRLRCYKHGLVIVRAPKPTLEGWPAPSTGDENSDEAADAVMEVAGAQRRRVLAALARLRFASAQELEYALGLPGNSVRPRIWELRRAGLIERVGKGSTSSGRSCWRYGLTETGERVAP